MALRPYCHIGALLFKAQNSPTVGKGTAILISPNLVLTAAHNIRPKNTTTNNYDFKFYPGQCGLLQKCYTVESFFFPEEFKKGLRVPKYDYAILKLNEEIPSQNKFIPLSSDLSEIKTASIRLFGYPSQSNNYIPIDEKGSNWKAYQFGLIKAGQILEVDEKKAEVTHTISTRIGQSGAPIILEDSRGRLSIVGIHKGGVKKGNASVSTANSGRIVTPELISILRREAEKLGAIPFRS